MSDDFRTTFVVEAAPKQVWEALTKRTLARGESDATLHYVLPAFPSFEALPMPGASCTPLEVDPQRLLRVRKDHEPCKGTEIAIRIEQVDTGTRITLVQSGFGPFLDLAGKDVVFSHGHQIARDLHLYLERGVIAPGTRWGVSLAARTRELPFGLEIENVLEVLSAKARF